MIDARLASPALSDDARQGVIRHNPATMLISVPAK